MRSTSAAVTELPISPEQERRSRMIKYTIAMAIRMVCIVLCIFVRGWWLLLPAFGAVVLPYIAVVIANATMQRVSRVERPGALVPLAPSASGTAEGDDRL